MKAKVLALFISVIVIAVPFLISSTHNHNNDAGIPLLLSTILALLFVLFIKLEVIISAALTTAGGIIAMIIGMFIDWHYDPTSHNLFPFEIVINTILFFIASIIGAGFGFAFSKLFHNKMRER
jgi:hypothetical protein